MTIEEKRKKLDDFCHEQENCYDCLLEYFSRACVFHIMEEDEVERAYTLIPKRPVIKKDNQLKNENSELKRLLRLATDDLNMVKTHISDFYCELTDCDDCPYTITLLGCKWKHYREAMKLLSVEYQKKY